MFTASIIIGITSLIMAAASTAYGITTSIQNAKAQAEMQQAQAKLRSDNLRQQAAQEEQNQLQRSLVERRQNARRLAAAETQYAASGVSLEGTPTLALERMSEEQELETVMQEAASGQKRQLWLTDAANTELMGNAGADMTERAGYINAIGTGLSGAADMGWKGYTLHSKGTFNTKTGK